MPTEGMFLQLLVSQLQNQDPLNPTDSTQFVSQLAQISELEQVIGIRGDLETDMTAQGVAIPSSTSNATAATSQDATPAATTTSTSTSTGGVTSANNQIL
jgi:flagellar basal-body rod modification protein FlgD